MAAASDVDVSSLEVTDVASLDVTVVSKVCGVVAVGAVVVLSAASVLEIG